MRRRLQTRPLSSTAGVTLLEILIAIVLLLIGVLAVVRIYPTGLELIRHGGLRSIALRLAEQPTERWKGRPDTLPDAVIALDGTGNPDAFADRNAEFETDDPPWQSALTSEGYEQLESLRFRQVLRENAVIPAKGIYALAGGLAESGSESVTVRYIRAPHNSLADLSLLNDQRHYAINYATGEVWFDNDTNAARPFLIDYAYIDGNTGQQQWILGEPHVAPQALSGQTGPTRTVNLLGAIVNNPNSGIVRGSETIRRLFVAGGVAPFGFNALSGRGVLEFAPENAGLPVEISYNVIDWRIIQEEKTVALEGGAANPEFVIYTILPFIQNRRDDPNYGGLDLTGNSPDVQIVDVEDPRNLLSFDPTNTNYRAGRLVLTGNVYEGQRVRVFYRTIDQWAVQPLKAASTYYEDWRNSTFDPAAPDLTDYSPAQTNPNRYRYGLLGGELYLAFYPSEAGQAVVVDYRYEDPGTWPVRVEGEMHTIPDTTTNVGGTPMCLVRLNTPTLQGARRFTIDRVQGASLTVRVSWHEKTVIKRVELVTYLTRP